MTLAIGDRAPDFTMPTNGGGTVSLSDYAGQKLVLYFYPKDDTSGCTKEACQFRAQLDELTALNTAVLGVSRCSVEKHDKFVEKFDLTFPLGSDTDGSVTEAYGVWVEKSMYGNKYMGIERATYLIGEDGTIRQIWRKVKVTDHVKKVIKEIKAQEA